MHKRCPQAKFWFRVWSFGLNVFSQHCIIGSMHRLLDLTTNRGQRRSLVRRLAFFWKQSEDQSRIFGCSNVTYVTERKWKIHLFQIQRQPSKLHEAIDGSGWSTLCVLTCVPQRQQAYCLKASDKCFFFSLDILILSVYDTFRRKIDISFRYFVS